MSAKPTSFIHQNEKKSNIASQKVRNNLKVNSTGIDFRPNIGRVLNRPFIPADPGRVSGIIDRVLAFTGAEAQLLRNLWHNILGWNEL